MSSGSSGLIGGAHASDGSIQSLYNFLDPGNIMGKSNSGDIAANFLDPGNLFGMNPAADPTLNGQAPGSAADITLPPPSGNIYPFLYDPNSFVARQPTAPGQFNAMVAALAGPQYVPRVMKRAVPAGVQPKPGQRNLGNDPARSGRSNGVPAGGSIQLPSGQRGNPIIPATPDILSLFTRMGAS